MKCNKKKKDMLMLGIFSSKQKKLVKKWSDEHQQIVEIAGVVVKTYTTHNVKECKKALTKMSGLVSGHFMDEDLEFFKLKREKKIDAKTEKSITDFVDGFKKTKISLMNFFSHYSSNETPLDEEFFTKFNEIVDAVVDRIGYEEDNLYEIMIRN